MTSIESLLRSEMALFLLECARVAGVVIVTPLAWSHAPNRIRVVLVLLMGWIAHGVSMQGVAAQSVGQTIYATMLEFTVGLGMGLVVRFVVASAEICGEIVSPAVGLGIASAFDPTTQSHESQIAIILRHFIVLIALVMGLHRVVLGGLLAGFRLLPVGVASNVAVTLPGLVQLSASLIASGVRMALPLVAILYMTQIALAFIARAAPQMQVFNVGFAVMLAVGLAVFALVLPDVARAFVIELSQVATRLEEQLMLLGARP